MKRKLLWNKSIMLWDLFKKEILKRNVKDVISSEKIAKSKSSKELLNMAVKSHRSLLVRKLLNVDLTLQEKNKVTNINLACKKINGLIIHPNEVFLIGIL